MINSKQYFVYIITNKYNTVLYTGVTGNLARRIYEHKNKLVKGFSQRYSLNKLVYYEVLDSVEVAAQREKQIKGVTRIKKERLINSINVDWLDLYDSIL